VHATPTRTTPRYIYAPDIKIEEKGIPIDKKIYIPG
jgi:hypothetical protein